MKKKLLTLLGTTVLAFVLMAGCGGADSKTENDAASAVSNVSETENADKDSGQEETDSQDKNQVSVSELEDGTYTAEFSTDSSMFHVSEACDGKGTLTVKDGRMVIHVSLNSKNIVNLYPGTAEDAQKEGAELLQPTTDTVTYSDGLSEEVYGFDVPVPVLDEEFDLALIGKKGTWYDHKVMVSNPEKTE